MEETVTIAVPGGPRLEGRLGLPPAAHGGLVLCHPHPLYGGDMDNPVVLRAAEVARDRGAATLRFNFRGVGASEGVHDNGRGEQEDVRAALAHLAARLGTASRLALLGYSFGAWVSAHVAASDTGLRGLGLIAPPLEMFDPGSFEPAGREVLLVAGTRDPYAPTAELERLGRQLPGARVVVIEAADHFFSGRLFPLGEAVGEWVRRWAAG